MTLESLFNPVSVVYENQKAKVVDLVLSHKACRGIGAVTNTQNAPGIAQSTTQGYSCLFRL